MANTYNASGVTLTEARFGGGGGLVLLINGRGTFTVDGDRHTLEIVTGQVVGPLTGHPVNATGVASVNPPAIGSFLIHETMQPESTTLPIRLNGPIFLAVNGVQQPAAAEAQ